MVLGDFGPGAFRDQVCADIGEFRVLEDAQGGALDVDRVACVEEGFRGGRGQSGAVLESFGLEGSERPL